jgi:hypothetical protein
MEPDVEHTVQHVGPSPARSVPVPVRQRRPWWIWVVPAVLLYTVLVWQNASLFRTSMNEQGDSAANSLLVRQAMRLTLLVGHYSREGFFNPGPAYLYVKAFGEWLGYDVLHLVPTPWNGQFLAVFALNSVMAGIAVAIVYGWTRRLVTAAAAFAIVCGLVANFPLSAVSGWPPQQFVLTYLVFLLAAASVAARRTEDLWVLALAGCMLIHGYAQFLFFVPVTVVFAAVIALWPDRRDLARAVGDFLVARKRAWVPALAVSIVFAFPVALNVILHGPGQFHRYLAYSHSAKAGGHSLVQVMDFVKWYWWPHSATSQYSVIAVAVAAAGFVLTRRHAGDVLRREFTALLVLAVMTTLAFGWFVANGVDILSYYYIGYFYWSVPFTMILIVVIGLAQALPRRPGSSVVALAGAAAVLAATAFGVQICADVHDDNPTIPGAVSAMAADSHGRMNVLTQRGSAWVISTGIILQAQRTGVPVCITNPTGTYSVLLKWYVCTPADLADGVRYTVTGPIWHPRPTSRRLGAVTWTSRSATESVPSAR